jgi:hypothetical protein
MIQEEQEDFLKSLKKKSKQEEEKMSDEESEGEIEGDPVSSRPVFKTYLLRALSENQLDQKRAAKMEILDFLTLLN